MNALRKSVSTQYGLFVFIVIIVFSFYSTIFIVGYKSMRLCQMNIVSSLIRREKELEIILKEINENYATKLDFLQKKFNEK